MHEVERRWISRTGWVLGESRGGGDEEVSENSPAPARPKEHASVRSAPAPWLMATCVHWESNLRNCSVLEQLFFIVMIHTEAPTRRNRLR